MLFSGTGSGNISLGTLGGASSIAYAINGSGQIVGTAANASQANHATLFSGTGTGNMDLGTLGGFNSYAYGINDSGQIVGSSALTGTALFTRSYLAAPAPTTLISARSAEPTATLTPSTAPA